MLKIRYVQPSDLQDVYTLSNDTVVRLNSINKEHIEWQEHVRWFNEKLNSDDSIFYILEYDNNFTGYCRLDRKINFWIISIAISTNYRNIGLGSKLLHVVCSKNSDKQIVAYVNEKNTASSKLFLKNNFIYMNNVIIHGEKYVLFKFSC